MPLLPLLLQPQVLAMCHMDLKERAILPPEINFQVVTMESCNRLNGVEHAAYLHYMRNASVYFGPGCNNGKFNGNLNGMRMELAVAINLHFLLFAEMLVVGRLASRWNGTFMFEWTSFITIFQCQSLRTCLAMMRSPIEQVTFLATKYTKMANPFLYKHCFPQHSFRHARLRSAHIRNGDGTRNANIHPIVRMETGMLWWWCEGIGRNTGRTASDLQIIGLAPNSSPFNSQFRMNRSALSRPV